MTQSIAITDLPKGVNYFLVKVTNVRIQACSSNEMRDGKILEGEALKASHLPRILRICKMYNKRQHYPVRNRLRE